MTVRYLALGDSYTVGEGVAATQRWPVKLVALLRQRAIDVGDPLILAKTGWTTEELRSATSDITSREFFDLVSLLIGVNDQYRGYDVARYRQGFSDVLARAIELSGNRPAHVVVVSVPDWSVTPFADGRDRARISGEIELFNSVNAEIAAAAGVRRVDITDASHDIGGAGELLVSDGLHPGPTMYERWAELVLPAAVAALA